MKIVYITHYTDLYGANKSLLNLFEGMSVYKNIEIHLVVPRTGKITDVASERNIKYSVIPFYNEIHLGELNGKGLINRCINTAKEYVKFLFNCWTVLRHSSTFKDCDIIHMNSTATLIGSYFAYWTKKKLVWHIREFGWDDYRIKYNFGYKYFQYWLNKADAVISISKAIYEKRGITSKTKQKSVIYNGVISKRELQEHKQYFIRNKNINESEITFAIVGHISPEKGLSEAVYTFHMLLKKYHNVRLLIVGQGSDQYVAELVNYIRENGFEDKVVFTGYIEKIEEIYTAIHCLLMCARHEAFGRVTIEAMSYGIPVIGYNGGGTAEIIKDGYNGWLYSSGHELYEKLSLFITNDMSPINYSKNAIETAENYTIEEYASSVYNIYIGE